MGGRVVEERSGAGRKPERRRVLFWHYILEGTEASGTGGKGDGVVGGVPGECTNIFILVSKFRYQQPFPPSQIPEFL